MVCSSCGKAFAAEPLDSNPLDFVEVVEVRDVIWYLRSIRSILLYFMWLSIAGLILGTLIALAN